MSIKKLVTALLFILLNLVLEAQEIYTVSGYVKDIDRNEPIIGAAVFQLNTVTNGTPTDTEGWFSLDFKKNDIYIKVAYIGFKDTVINLFVYSDTVINVFLKNNTEIEEVRIEDDEIRWKAGDYAIKGDVKIINAELANQKPPIQTKGIFIPKIKKDLSPLKIDELFLRNGSGQEQALVYINGARLFSSRRSTEINQVIDDNSVGSINYFYGNFPAKFGGFIAPVLDINLREGNMHSYKGAGTISLFDASVYAEGPVIENKSSFYLSAHRSFMNYPYTDLFRKEADNMLWAKPVSFDLNTTYTHQLTENDKVKFSFLTFSDKLSFENSQTIEDSIDYEFTRKYSDKTTNTITNLSFQHIFSPDLITEASLFFSRYNLKNTFEGDSIGLVDGNRSRINNYNVDYTTGNEDFGLNVLVKYNLNTDHRLNFGTTAMNHHFRPIKANMILNDFEHSSYSDTDWVAEAYNAQEYLLFAEDLYNVTDRLTLQGGIHFSVFSTNGTNYFSIQPRLYADYKLFENLSVRASYSNYKQYLHVLSNRSIGLSTDIFIPSDNDILPQFSHSTSAGVSIKLPFKINLTADAYFRISNHVTEYKNNYGFFNFDDAFVYPGFKINERLEQGKENAYGLRVLINKDFKNLSIKAAHYISSSDRSFENLNFSDNFTYRHNRTHDFKLLLNYKINDQMNAGIEWEYRSGNYVTVQKQNYLPYNYIEGRLSSSFEDVSVYSVSGELIDATDDINTYRLPAFHQADLFLSYQLDNHLISFKLYNLYNRKNPDFTDFKKDVFTNDISNQLVNYTIMPFFPVLSYTYTFE